MRKSGPRRRAKALITWNTTSFSMMTSSSGPVAVFDRLAPTAQSRAWCPTCVGARSTDQPHRASKELDEHAVPEFRFDYAFLRTRAKRRHRRSKLDETREHGCFSCIMCPEKALSPLTVHWRLRRTWTISGAAVLCSCATTSQLWLAGGALAVEGYDHGEVAGG